MTTVVATYLGWERPEHREGCKRPDWHVDYRTDPESFRSRGEGAAHECANEDCWHGDRYARTTVRVVCTSCQAALVLKGEACGVSQGRTATITHGFGLPPRKLAGLLLWPGEPFMDFGRLSTDEPYDLLVTRPGVKRVTRADVVGMIMMAFGKRGAVTWTAAVGPQDSKYLRGQINWARTSTNDATLRSVAAAAKWIAARLLDEQQAQNGGDAG